MARTSGKRGAGNSESPEGNGKSAFEAKLWATANALRNSRANGSTFLEISKASFRPAEKMVEAVA